MRRKRYSSSDHAVYASSFRRARQTPQRISFYFRSTFDHPFVERHGLSASFPLSPVFVAECVLYTRGWTISGGKTLGRVDIQLEILSSTVLILSFLVFPLYPLVSFLCYVSRLALDRLDLRAPRLENPKRKCFRFVREAGIILSRVHWLAFIPRNFFLPSCKLFPMKIRFIRGERFLFRVIVSSEYSQLPYVSTEYL